MKAARSARGFDSAAEFRTTFLRLAGLRAADLSEAPQLCVDWIETDLGAMIAISDHSHLYLLEFLERKALPGEVKKLIQHARGALGFGRLPLMDQVAQEMARFMAGENARFEVPLAPLGSAFSQQVWQGLRELPAGQTESYADCAARLGKPKAVRAVARANAANPIAIVIPCHRLVGSDGTLRGYGGGIWRKRALLEFERAFTDGGAAV